METKPVSLKLCVDFWCSLVLYRVTDLKWVLENGSLLPLFRQGQKHPVKTKIMIKPQVA